MICMIYHKNAPYHVGRVTRFSSLNIFMKLVIYDCDYEEEEDDNEDGDDEYDDYLEDNYDDDDYDDEYDDGVEANYDEDENQEGQGQVPWWQSSLQSSAQLSSTESHFLKTELPF